MKEWLLLQTDDDFNDDDENNDNENDDYND